MTRDRARRPETAWRRSSRYEAIMKMMVMAIRLFLAALLLLVCSGPGLASEREGTGTAEETMARQLTLGDFRGAIKGGRQALPALHQAGDEEATVRLSLRLAEAYEALGANREAIDLLNQTMILVKGEKGQGLKAAVEARLGGAYLLSGEDGRARELLALALAEARRVRDHQLMAAVLNTQGNLLVLQKGYPAAMAAYREGIELSGLARNPGLTAKILANAGRAEILTGRVEEAEGYLKGAREIYQSLPNSHDKAFGMINIGKSYDTLIPVNVKASESYATSALTLFGEALTVGQALGDQGAIAYAAGYLGEALEQADRGQEALTFTGRAEFAAIRAAAPESLYLWQWQAGRILAHEGRRGEAIKAYQRAVATLQAIRGEFEGECRGYNQSAQWSTKGSVEPVYLGLVDLLLQEGREVHGAGERQALLAEAIASLEAMKSNELRGYFRNTCIEEKRISFAARENIPSSTAIVYPIPLADRLELIVSLPDGLRQFTVKIDQEHLAARVKEFRYQLENRTSREYLASGRQLHELLVAPLMPELVRLGIDTLVFVPEGPLRTIPFAALHDGARFLIDRFAVATIPSLGLTDLGQAERKGLATLLAGVSESNQGFAPLAYVPDELAGIHALYGGKVLLNRAFNALAFRAEFAQVPYSIVHIATHGEFKENSAETFIVAWDSRIDMDLLEKTMRVGRYRRHPVDLLTLSACQSAAASERAALGLAGLSLKAGVRSAVATLWYVDDQSSSGLMAEFYRQLADPAFTKARALQEAQKRLLADNRYRHPAYWAPFLLIGNWN